MALALTARELSEKYDRFAPWYDWVESILDLFGLRRLRRKLLQRVRGTVLEVAVGTGKNFPFYPDGQRIITMDISAEMLNVARRRAARLAIKPSFLRADAEALPFRDKNFDTVVSSLSTCTFPNPVGALKEMARLCRSDGKILLLEHGRSDRERIGHWQDSHVQQFAKPLGCHWNREPLVLVRSAGLKVQESQRFFFGIFHLIEATANLRIDQADGRNIMHE